MNARLLLLHALSPLHAGTGQGVGVIDLPIAREKATGLPYLPGSSLKGTLRDQCKDPPLRKKVFGPSVSDSPDDNPSDYASSIQVSDQRLLLLPVRSLRGLFAFVTCPYILQRFARDARAAGINGTPTNIPTPALEKTCLITQSSNISKQSGNANQVVLEDLDLDASTDAATEGWSNWIAGRLFPDDASGQQLLATRFCVVQDNILNFLLETATEITARIKMMEETKTVERGGLWYEEALPAETILSGLVVATQVKASPDEVFQAVGRLISKPVQFGGKATVGRGICRLRMVTGGA
jgi:CRISPR-associated protein Cmr4